MHKRQIKVGNTCTSRKSGRTQISGFTPIHTRVLRHSRFHFKVDIDSKQASRSREVVLFAKQIIQMTNSVHYSFEKAYP